MRFFSNLSYEIWGSHYNHAHTTCSVSMVNIYVPAMVVQYKKLYSCCNKYEYYYAFDLRVDMLTAQSS